MVCTEFECLSDGDSLYQIKGGSQYELRVSQAVYERMDLCIQIMPQTGAQVESVSARHPAYESGALDSVLHMAECITEWTSGAQAHNLPGSVSVSSFFDFHTPYLRHPIHFTTHACPLPLHLSLLAYSIP